MHILIKVALGILIGGIFYLLARYLQRKGYSKTSYIMYIITLSAVLLASFTTNFISENNASWLSLISYTLQDMIIFIIFFVLILYLDKRKHND